MKNWESPFFLTLTVKAVNAEGLKQRMDEMCLLLNRIMGKFRKRKNRGKGFSFVGIKSLECNYNPEKGTYNPHFHLVLKNLKMADTLRTEWIREGRKLWGQTAITPAAQHNVRVMNLKDCLIEVIKYTTKVFTSPDDDKDLKREKRSSSVYVAAYDTIIQALKGRRVFDRFGFNLPPRNANKGQVQFLKYRKEWFYLPEFSDWVEIDGPLTLTGYVASKELRIFLENSLLKSG